jgi:hypothetical protein
MRVRSCAFLAPALSSDLEPREEGVGRCPRPPRARCHCLRHGRASFAALAAAWAGELVTLSRGKPGKKRVSQG